jgi:hypothetical protein
LLITDVLEKNGTSLTKFLAMVRQLTVKSEYKFEDAAPRIEKNWYWCSPHVPFKPAASNGGTGT